MEELHQLTRQSELNAALPILAEAAEAYTKALSLLNELALMLALDNGIPFDPVVDRATFIAEEDGSVYLRIFYPCGPESSDVDSCEQGDESAFVGEQLGGAGPMGDS